MREERLKRSIDIDKGKEGENVSRKRGVMKHVVVESLQVQAGDVIVATFAFCECDRRWGRRGRHAVYEG